MNDNIIKYQEFKSYKKSTNVFFSECIELDNDDIINIIDPEDGTTKLFSYKLNERLPFSLYKYLPQKRAKMSLIDKPYLTFVSPNLWEDPFEYEIYDENILNGIKVFCFCTSFSRSHNEESFWKRHDPNFEGKYVMWSINFFSLVNELQKTGKSKGIRFYVAPINYSLSRNIIESFMANKPTNEIDLVTHLCVKRKAFKHECEMRIFAVIDNNSKIRPTGDLLRININLTAGEWDKRILTKVVLPPYKPGKRNEYFEYEYPTLQYKMNHNMRTFYSKLGFNNKNDIEQCHLYEVKEYSNDKIKRLAAKI